MQAYFKLSPASGHQPGQPAVGGVSTPSTNMAIRQFVMHPRMLPNVSNVEVKAAKILNYRCC